jgi:hypothetical protein
MRVLIALLLCAWAFRVDADYSDPQATNPYYQSPEYFDTWAFNNRAGEILKRNHKTIFPDSPFFPETPAVPASVGSDSTKAPILSRNKPSAGTIRKLSAFYPSIPRPEAKRLFAALYKFYGQLEKTLGIPKYDLAGAVAAAIAANYMGYRNTLVADADFSVLVGQVRQALQSNTGFARQKAAQKRSLYEQLAIFSTFTTAIQFALQQQPNADYSLRFQEASRINLEGLLGISADRVLIDSNGILIQPE